MATIEKLDFKLIIDDSKFNQQVENVKKTAQELNTEISNILNVKTDSSNISAKDHQSRMRQIKEEAAQMMANQKQQMAMEMERTKIENERAKGVQNVAREEAKVINEKKKGLVIDEQIAAASQKRIAAENQTASAAAIAAQKKVAAEQQAAAAVQKRVAAEQNALRAERQREISEINKATAEERKAAATNRRIASQKRLNAELEKEKAALTSNSKLMMQLKNLATGYFSVLGASRLISNLVRVSAEFEKQRISLEAILKDVSGADRLFNQMKELAVRSPFQFKELVTYTKQLSAFSVPMNELYDTTKMLADVSAGLGVGMDRLILAYGQIRSASFLRGQEVRQLTEAGVPILEELRKQFEEMGEIGITAGQVFDKISARQVTFEMVEKVFKDMTSEGGKFYKMQEVLAETLSGKISNLKDAYQIMFSEIGEKSNGILVKSVDALRSLAENYQKVGKMMLEVVAIFGAYKASSIFLTIAHWTKVAQVAGKTAPLLAGLSKAMKGNAAAAKLLGAISKINPYAALAAGALAAVIAINKVMRAENQALQNQKAINKATADYSAEVENERIKLDFLFGQLKSATKGTDEYNVAKKRIIDNYGQYLTDLDRENLALGNQVEVYNKLIAVLKQTAREKAFEAGSESILAIYSKTAAGVVSDYNTLMGIIKSKVGVPEAVEKQLDQYFRSEIDKEAFTEEGRQIYQALTDGVLQEAEKSPITGGYLNQFTNNYRDELPFNLDDLRQRMADANSVMQSGTTELRHNLDLAFGPMLGEGGGDPPALKDWQAAIQKIVKEAEGKGIILNLKVDENSDPGDVINRVKEELEETTTKAREYLGIDDKLAESFRKQATYYQRINREVLRGNATPGSSGGGGAGGDDRVKQIKAEIDAYKTLKEAYQSLVEYMDEESARRGLGGIFGDVFGTMTEADFDAKINSLIDELKNLGDAGLEAAQSLLEGFAMDKFKQYQKSLEEAAKVTEDFNEMMEGMREQFSLAGLEGADLDIAKIVQDYRNKLQKLQDEEEKDRKLVLEKAKNEGWGEDIIQNYFQQITEYYANETANALAEASDKAKDALEKFYKEVRDGKMDFSNFSDKSIRQLENMKNLISEIINGEMNERTVANLNAVGLTLDDIISALERLAEADIQVIDDEEEEKLNTDWKRIAKDIAGLADSIEELGEASGNATLANIGSMLAQMGELADTILSAMESGNWVGAFVSVAVSAANKVFQAMAKAAQAAAQAREEIRKIVTDNYLDTMRDRIESTSTLFGESFLGNVRAVNSAIGTLKKDIDNIFRSTGGSGKGGLLEFLQALSKASGIKLFDDSGVINKEVLDLFEAAAKGGDFASSAMMAKYGTEFKNLRDLSDELREMLEQLDATVGEIFSNMGESITDELIDKLNQTGEVVSDLEGVFQSLGDTIMKSLIQSVVVDEILSKYEEQVKSWFTTDMSADQMAAEMDRFADNVRTDIEAASDKIKGIYDAFKSRDLISGGEASESGLTNGIKGVTEETASLLASYINAIRADVAYNRLQLEDVRGDVRMMVGLLPSAPTLAEYLTQIQANTFNTAARTEAILLHLEELTTAEGGAAALRVFM